MTRKLMTLLCAMAFIATLAGCGQSSDTGSNATAPASGGTEASAPEGPKPLTLAFITNNTGNFWQVAEAGCREAISELENVKLEFHMPGQMDTSVQQQIIEDVIVKGVDGIALSPINPENQTDFLNDVASKALLITQDSDAPNSNRVCYIGTNNKAAGHQAGELLKEILPNGGRIMIFVGTVDAQNALERLQGIKDEIADTNIKIIDVRTDDSDQVRAKSNVEDTLVKFPNVSALVGLYEYNGPAILSAVKAKGLQGQMPIVCFDENEDVLLGIKDGFVYGTVVQQPFMFGKESILRMAAYLRGDKTVFPEDGINYVDTLKIKKDTVEEYHAQLKKLLGQ